jgi:lauroyl/myristoyl acyltransferase
MTLFVFVGRLQVLLLPLSAPFWFGRVGVRLMFRLLPGMRSALLDNAAHVLGPESTPAERKTLALGVLINFSRFFVELLSAPLTYPDPDAFFSRERGKEHGLAAHAQGKGVIGITLHMGNFELGSMMLAGRFDPVAVVYHRDPYGALETLRSRKRSDHKVEEIATDASRFFTVPVRNVLRRGGFALVAGDVGFAHQKGEVYPFLGGHARFLTWPARMALSTGAPILPCFVVRGEDGNYAPIMEPAIDPAEAGDVDTLMKRLIAVYEVYVRRYPDQWLILHKYWEDAAHE